MQPFSLEKPVVHSTASKFSAVLIGRIVSRYIYNSVASKDQLQVGAILTYKTRSTGGTLAYLASLLERYRPGARTLRSTNNNLHTVPQLSLALSVKAFCVSGPTVCNSSSNNCKQAELVPNFKRKIKSELVYLASYREQSSV